MVDLLVAAATSLGVSLLVGVATFRLNASLEDKKIRVATRTAAYVAYLGAAVEASLAKQLGRDDALHAGLARVVAAKMQIGLYGSAEVIDAIVAAEDAKSNRERFDDAFVTVFERMRADSLNVKVGDARLRALLQR